MCGYNNSGCVYTEDDPSPPGVSLSPGSYTFVDPCECVEAGICPWCGSALVGDLMDFGLNSDLKCGRENDETCAWTWQLALELINEPPDIDYGDL